MSLFRNRRLSVDQLQMVLRSLPQAKAPADLEEKLNHTIAEHSDHVPHVLGTLPLISAPDDFDARLMDAIRSQRRRPAPIPHWHIADPAAINWVNHITGWIGGAVVAVGLAFFIHSVDGSRPGQAIPAAAHSSGSVSGVTPGLASPPVPGNPPVSSVTPERMSAGPSAPQSAERMEQSQAVRQDAPSFSATRRDARQPAVQRSASAESIRVKSAGAPDPGSLNAATHGPENHGIIAPPREVVDPASIPAKIEDTPAVVTAPEANGTSVSAGMGQVNTGREQIQDSTRSNP